MSPKTHSKTQVKRSTPRSTDIKYSVYWQHSGHCKVCKANALWGDAPHYPGCEFLLMAKMAGETI